MKNTIATLKAYASKGRAALSVLAGIAAELITLNIAHGTVAQVAEGIIAAATALGVHAASLTLASKAAAEAKK